MRRFFSCKRTGGPNLNEYISSSVRSTGQRSYSRRNKAETVPVRCRPPWQCTATGQLPGSSNRLKNCSNCQGLSQGQLCSSPIAHCAGTAPKAATYFDSRLAAGPSRVQEPPIEPEVVKLQAQNRFHSMLADQPAHAELRRLRRAVKHAATDYVESLQMRVPEPEIAPHARGRQDQGQAHAPSHDACMTSGGRTLGGINRRNH